MALLRLYLTQLRAQQATAPHTPPGAKSTAAPGTAHATATVAAPRVEPSRYTSASDSSGARMT